MKDILHNGLSVVAVVMLIVGAVLGLVWGVSALVGNSIMESGMQAKIGSRILCVLFFGSAGLFHMLAFWNYQRSQRARWKESKS
jgi:hypothetical protein